MSLWYYNGLQISMVLTLSQLSLYSRCQYCWYTDGFDTMATSAMKVEEAYTVCVCVRVHMLCAYGHIVCRIWSCANGNSILVFGCHIDSICCLRFLLRSCAVSLVSLCVCVSPVVQCYYSVQDWNLVVNYASTDLKTVPTNSLRDPPQSTT